MKRCKIDRTSDIDRVFLKINKEMAWPVGIVLFGADCDQKDEILQLCMERIPNLATGYGGKGGNIALRGAKRPFSEGRSVLTVMDGESSCSRAERVQTGQALRDLGAKTVVGFYAYYDSLRPHSDDGTPQGIKRYTHATRISYDPPRSDEFDYLLTPLDD